MTDPSNAPSSSVPDFGYQLLDVYLLDCSVTRRAADGDELQRPNIDLALAAHENAAEDEEPGFTALLSVDVQFRFQPDAVCEIKTRTVGAFREVGALKPDERSRFRDIDCAVLIWPYSRSIVGELVRLTGLSLAPLPTIDVRRALASWRGGATPSQDK